MTTSVKQQHLSAPERTWLEEGRHLSGIQITQPSSSSPHQLPDWVDPVLLKEGQAFVQRHLFSVLFAHLVSLLFLLAYAPVRSVLLVTRRSSTPQKSKLRYASTLLHVKKWYEGDLLPADGKAPTVADIGKVCRIHAGVVSRVRQHFDDSQVKVGTEVDLDVVQIDEEAGVGQGIRDDFARYFKNVGETEDSNNNNDTTTQDGTPEFFFEGADPIPPIISQLDMAITQFCFMGFVPLFPRTFGLPPDEDAVGVKGFLHMWALLGHLLGIRPQFNLALPENESRRALVWTSVLIPSLAECAPQTWRLWSALVQGLNSVIPFLKLEALLVFVGKRLINVDKEDCNVWSELTLTQRVSFYMLNACFTSWVKFSLGRRFFNAMVRLAIKKLAKV
ncbi:uncharacterized protein LOC110856752 isoform X2 [Folsomia candida]|uniref:uncharacterized protein LOC110856752 isoform X2 n=1 Tax=Folsomia candida TaxID=158441 RepID=UPI000B8FE05C|nr:uncharacterized protein LOC110856752 isoform X2 [Folsomia candida]